MTDKRRGRPSGLLINPVAFSDLLAGRSQAEICRRSESISTAHLSEMLSGSKGATTEVAERLAETIGCRPATLFPQLVEFKVQVKQFTVGSLVEVA